MDRATVLLVNAIERDKASKWCASAPEGTVVEFRKAKRSIPQNDRLHAMLTPLSKQLLYHGLKLSVDDWKLVFMASLNTELRLVPNLDGTGFVDLGRKTSRLSKPECTDLMTLIEMYGAKNGVDFGSERKDAA